MQGGRAQVRQEPHHGSLVSGSVITMTWQAPPRTSFLLGFQLEENIAQISQGLESDGLSLGIKV